METVIAANGEAALTHQGVALFSLYRPSLDVEKQAARTQAEPGRSFVVLFGSALGYSAKAFMKMGFSPSDLALCPLAEESSTGRPETSIAGLTVTDPGKLSVWLEEQLKQRKKPLFFALDGYRRAFPERLSEMEGAALKALKIATENLKVTAYFSKLWCLNAARNLRTAQTKQNTFVLKEKPARMKAPVLIAAAGPSLDDALDWIREHRSGFLLISVLSAARTLLSAGIVPDAVVLSDAGPANRLHAAGLPPEVPVFSGVYAYSGWIASMPNPWIMDDFIRECRNPSYALGEPSVVMDALALAGRITEGECWIAGFDLSYPLSAKSHSASNALFELREVCENRLNPRLKRASDFMARRDLKRDGEKLTQPQFALMAEAARRYPGVFAFPGCASIPGWKRWEPSRPLLENADKEWMAFLDACPGFPAYEKEAEAWLARIGQKWQDTENGGVFLREMLSGMDEALYRDYRDGKLGMILGDRRGE